MSTKLKIFVFSLLLIFSSITFYGKLIDTIVARVNGNIITLSELNDYYFVVKNIPGAYSKERVLDELIKTEILFQLSSDFRLEVSEKEIQAEVNRFKKKTGTTSRSEFQKALRKQGIKDIDFLRYEIKKLKTTRNLVGYIIRSKLVVSPKAEEIQKIYAEHKDQFHEKAKVKISHILIKIDSDNSFKEVKNKEKTARNLIELLKSKKEDFESLAKKYSNDRKSANRGGYLGWFDESTLTDVSVKYSEKAFELKKGEFSDLIWTDHGINIIKVLDKRNARKIPFSEAKKYIRQKMLNDRGREQLIKMLKAKTKFCHIEKKLIPSND